MNTSTTSSKMVRLISTESIVHGWFILISISLRGIIHFNIPAQKLSSIHLLQCSFGFFFNFKFNKSITFRNATNWINNDFSFKNRFIDLLESMKKHLISNPWIQISNINLITFCLSILHWWRSGTIIIIKTTTSMMLTAHASILIKLLWRLIIAMSSSYTASMRSPI